ncbi:MgtC/SapB family protein [Sphingomonas sp.]|uniref:MgtC/SapB family protein n=1 Tax=Sphingomonas sp. TaxID=28214 RepID=UPI0038A4B308
MCVATALACGLLIGIERGFDLRGLRAGTRVAGVRTFTLLGLVSGVAGLAGRFGQPFAAGALVSGAVAVLAIGYAHRPGLADKPDATTPIAALATVGLGFVAGFGEPGFAIAGATIVTLLLALKAELHGLLDKLDEADVKALARYAVIAGAVLPFLPSGHYGPLGAWNPQRLWLVVVLVTGFSFLGYVANRIFGERHGTIATALIGGAYSSTTVTQALAQRLGSESRPGAENAGIALATAVMYLRVPALIAVFATRVLPPIGLLLLPAVAVAWGAGYWLYRKAPKHQGPAPPGNPIALLPALGFVAFVAVAAVAAKWAQGSFGQSGIAVLLLIVGSMDVDVAIVTLGGLPAGAISPLVAAMAIAGTIIANMGVKIGITLVYARRRGLPAAAAMASSLAALAVMIAFAWTRL